MEDSTTDTKKTEPVLVPENKPFYKSKTIWINLIALLAIIIQTQTGFIIDPVEQGALLTIINLVLRAVTKQGIE